MLGIFVLALVVRVVHLWGDTRSPFFAFRGIDALDYHQMAQGLRAGTWPADQPFFWAPLYPMFLGILYGIIGQGALALKLVHAVMGSASCVLLYRIGLRLTGRQGVAVAAGAAMALNGTLVYFDGQLLSACLDVFLQLLALELLLSAAQRQRVQWWWAAGLVIGLSAVNRGAILLLLPPLVVWVWGVTRRGWPIGGLAGQDRDTPRGDEATIASAARQSRAAAVLAAVLLPTAACIGLAVMHNVRVDGEKSKGDMGLLPVAHNLGINFYLGNHWTLRAINKTNHPQHFSRYDEIMMLPEKAGVAGAFAGSQYLVRQTLRDMRSSPGEWLRLMAVKMGELFHGAEIPRSGNLYASRRNSPVVSGLMWKRGIAFPGGIIIPLGLVGAGLALRRWRGHWLPLWMIVTQGVFVVMFFVTARYRLPMIPLLTLYGVMAVHALVAAVRRGAWVRGGLMAAAALGLGVACNWGVGGGGAEEHGYYEYCLLAQVQHQAGELDRAIGNYQEGLRLNPDYAWGHLHLGDALLRRGDARQAEEHLRRGLELEPETPNVPVGRVQLGRALAQQGRMREAIAEWEAALALDAHVPYAHAELCAGLRRLGRVREAETHCTAARAAQGTTGANTPTAP